MHSIVIFPKQFGLTVDVDGCPGSANDFLHFEFPKYIHFSSPVMIEFIKFFLSRRESKKWHADDHKWFSNQHLTSLPFVVVFVYSLHPTMLAIRHLQIFSVHLWFFIFQIEITTFESSKPTHTNILHWDIETVSFHESTMAFTRVLLLIKQEKQNQPKMLFICLGTRHVYHTMKISR